MKAFALVIAVQLAAGDAGVQAVAVERGVFERGDAGVAAEQLEQLGAAAADAGVPAPVLEQLTAGALLTAGEWVVAGAGCYQPSATCVGIGQVLGRQAAQVVELQRVPPGVLPQLIAAFIGFGLGFASAVGGAVLACKLAPGLCR